MHEWQILENSMVWKDKLQRVIGKPWIASSGCEAGRSSQDPFHTTSLLGPQVKTSMGPPAGEQELACSWEGHRGQTPLSQAAVSSRGPSSLSGVLPSSLTAWESFHNTVMLSCPYIFPPGGDLTPHGQRLRASYRVVSTVRGREGRCNIDVMEGEHGKECRLAGVTTRHSPPHPRKIAFCLTGPHIMLWWRFRTPYFRWEENESNFSWNHRESHSGFSPTENNEWAGRTCGGLLSAFVLLNMKADHVRAEPVWPGLDGAPVNSELSFVWSFIQESSLLCH